MLKATDPEFERFGEIYFSFIYPGVIKGPLGSLARRSSSWSAVSPALSLPVEAVASITGHQAALTVAARSSRAA